MSIVTFLIPCLTTSNLPWCIDLTFQVPVCNIVIYSIWLCSYHQSYPQLGVVFCFGSASSFFSKLFLCSSSVSYWAPTDLGDHLSMSYIFPFSILFIGFSRQEYWSGLPFPSPVNHILLELSTMTCVSWVALHGIVHSFIQSFEAVILVISLVSFLWLWFSVCLPSVG